MHLAWDDIRLVLEVHRAGSLTKAGRTLSADQSTVGRRLTSFEEKLGTKLFFRTPDGFVATPAGERLVAHSLDMEERAHAIAREVAGQEQRLTGTIRLTTPIMFGARIITPLLASFVERWPQIEVELVADDRFLNLSKREADMAIGNARPKDDHPGVLVRKFCVLGNGVYASRAYVKRHGRPGRGFEGHTMISDDRAPSLANRWIAENAPRAKVVLRSDATAVQVEAMRAGVGMAILSSYHVYDDPDVVELVSPALVPTETLWLALHKDLKHNARIRACADYLTAEIGKLDKRLRGIRPESVTRTPEKESRVVRAANAVATSKRRHRR